LSLGQSTKFVIGTTLSCVALICAIVVDLMIINEYNKTGQAISVLWQAPAFFFIGAGEIFAISSAYEAAFLIAPKNLKALSSATNIFLIGGLPQFISTAILSACTQLAFTNAAGSQDLETLASYSTAHVYLYFVVLLAIAVFGVIVNALPITRRFLSRTLAAAEEANSDQK
jgi:POT family proton-dependent oligopeptide transporter